MNGAELGKLLILLGLGAILIGFLIIALSKFISIGHLPGDIYVKKETFSFYFPVVSCMIISIVLSVIMHIFRR